ncbi:MAG TPA: ABC transporter permease [Hanamia sp.]|nr:ABC transporter permease [Hanamia sp.]
MFKNYIKTAWRNLLRNRVSSFINLSGLAIGLATSIMIMMVVMNEFSYDKFNTHLRDTYLVMKNQQHADGISTGDVTPGPIASALRSEMPGVKYAARIAYFGDQVISANNKVVYQSGVYVDPDIFKIMTFPALSGNPAASLQDPHSVVITEETAMKLFNEKDPVGKTITLNNKNSFTVTSVIKNIPFNSSVKFGMAFPFSFYESENPWLTKWDDNRIQTWVQLKPHAEVASLNTLMTKLVQARSNDSTVSLFAYPLSRLNLYRSFSNGKQNGGKIDLMILLMALGGFVLLIACINFMNIATARSEHRSLEVGVRKVLGASRKSLVYQFLREAILMAFIATIIGLIIAQLVLPLLNQYSGQQIPFHFSDYRIWLMLLATCLITGLIAGSYPALFLSRFRIIKVLKGIGVSANKGAGLRKTLVAIQFVISIAMIIGTIVIYSQINYVRNRPLGYDKDNLIDITATGELKDHYDLFKNKLSQIQGVINVSTGDENIVNFGGSVSGMDYPGKIPGRDIPVIISSVGYDWTKTAGIKVIEGRDFNPAFGTDTTACIINKAAVHSLGLKEPVLGQLLGGNKVIGVFQNFVYNNPSGIVAPMRLTLNTGGLSHIFVRIKNDNEWRNTLAQIESAAKKINPAFPFDFTFTKDVFLQRFQQADTAGFMATVFGCMAIFIACLGLFGLSAFVIERRGREMSIRKVFGASAKDVWFHLSGDFLKPVFIAILIVIPLSVWVAHASLSGVIYRVPLQWWMFALAALLVIAIALLTVSVQAIKAAVTNPVKNLRTE